MSLATSIPLFAGLPKLEQAKLLGDLEELEFPEGAVIVNAGDVQSWIYFVTAGKVEVSQIEFGSAVPIAFLGQGDLFGETGLTARAASAQTYRAITAVGLCRMPLNKLQRLLHSHPDLSRQLIQVLAGRIAATTSELGHTKAVLASYADQLWDSVPPTETDEAATIMQPVSEAPAAAAPTPAVPPWRRLKALASGPAGRALSGALSVLAGALVYRSVHGPHALAMISAVLTWAAWHWLVGILPDYTTALGVLAMSIVTGIVPPATAMSGFASPSWFLLLGVFGIGVAVSRSGLLYRVALHMLRLFPPTYRGQSLALAVAGLLSTPLLPSANGRTAMSSLLARELNEAMRLPPNSRGSAGMAMASFLGFGNMYFMFLNGTSVCMVVWSLLPESVRGHVTWLTWLWVALPVGLLVFAGSYLAILYMYPPEVVCTVSRRTIQAQLQVLGPMSRLEQITTAVLSIVLIGFVTQSLHNLNPAWIALIGFLVLIAAGAVDRQGLKSMDWGFMLLIGALVSLTEITKATGINDALAHWVGTFLAPLGSNPYLFLGAVSLLTLLVTLIVTAQQGIIIMVISLIPISVTLGYNPFVVALVVLVLGGAWILPQQNPVYLTVHAGTDGKAFTHRQVRPLALVQSAVGLLAVLASVPFWQMLHLIPK